MLRKVSLSLSLLAVMGFSASLVHFHISLTECENTRAEQSQHIHDSAADAEHDAVSCFLTHSLAKSALSVAPIGHTLSGAGLSTLLKFKEIQFFPGSHALTKARSPPVHYS